MRDHDHLLDPLPVESLEQVSGLARSQQRIPTRWQRLAAEAEEIRCQHTVVRLQVRLDAVPGCPTTGEPVNEEEGRHDDDSQAHSLEKVK